MSTELVQAPGLSVARFREATDVANVCKEIVLKTSVNIAGRDYVKVEGWTAIAVAHGCIASIKTGTVVEMFRDGKLIGINAVAIVKRQTDGMVLTEAEGFVGVDERTWYGSNGELVKVWSKAQHKEIDRVIPKRLDYAIRSMAQTRATSKACRNAFSHVVVLMNAGLSTTPAEEVDNPDDFIEVEADVASTQKAEDKAKKEEPKQRRAEPVKDDAPDVPYDTKTDLARAAAYKKEQKEQEAKAASTKPIEVPRDDIVGLERQFEEGKWKKVKVHFGKNKDRPLDDLQRNQLLWYAFKWQGGMPATEKYAAKPPSDDDNMLRAALNVAIAELGLEEPTD